MKTYIKVTPDMLIKMCETKQASLDKEEAKVVERYVKNNTKPERRFLYFFTRPEVTKYEAIKSLDEPLDEYTFDSDVTVKSYICKHVYRETTKVKDLISLAETANQSTDDMVRLNKDDHAFLKS